MEQKSLPVIFGYLDYRRFMQDYRKVRSENHSGFTHYYICHRLGMKNSRSYYNNITSGRKNISEETIEKLIDLFEFSIEEAQYFRELVNYNQAELPNQKEYHFEQLIKLNNAPKKIIPEDCYEYFKTWYHPVIREKLDGFNFKDNFSELASMILPPITEEEAKSSVHLLERLNLIRKDENGCFRVTEKLIVTDPNAEKTLIEYFQLQSLERARERITSRPKEHKTSTITFAISTDGLKRILTQIEQLKKAIRSIVHDDVSQEKKVYELITHISKQSN